MNARIEFGMSYVDALRASLGAVADRVVDECKAELYQFANEVMSESKRVVPVDTGALMSSGQVALPQVNGREISVTLGYGNQSVGYALYVHENMNPNVHWTRPGSGPKYLETPLKAKQGELGPRISQAVVRGFKGK